MIKSLFKGLAGPRGFTLVEMAVSMTIMTLVATVMASGVYQAFRAVPFQRSGLNSLDETRLTLLPITRDLQVATATSLTNGAAAVSPPVTFTSINPTTSVTRTTTYSLSGTNLLRKVDSGVAKTIGRNVSAVTFALSGSEYTLSLTSTTEGNQASAVTSTWTVYKRTAP